MLHFTRRQELVALCALVLTLLFILVDQADDQGLQKGHRGWCSSNVLAIIEQAVPSNGFVGYSLDYLHPDGKHIYQYFDRYPVFFSVAMHAVLHTFDISRGAQIYVARQAMNVLHVLTLAFGVALLVELELPLGLAIGATALAASGKLIVEYRDMVHFDHAAMLGFMGLLWAIARWYRTHDDRFVCIAACVAVSMGRGYASFAVLGTWWIVEAVRAVLAQRAELAAAPLHESTQLVKRLAWSAPTRACVLGIAIGAACLGYNVWTESKKNGVPLAEVGIVGSARRRIIVGDNKPKAKVQAKMLAWDTFAATTTARGLKDLEPWGTPQLMPKHGPGLLLGALAVALVVGAFIASRKGSMRSASIVAALSGLVWVFGMRGLTAFHEFTAMFLLSLGMLFMAGLVRFVPARFALAPALLGCACLVFATHARNVQLRKTKAAGEAYTADLQRIEALLEPGEPIAVEPHPRKLVPGVPYALGFFLPHQPILIEGGGKYLVTAKKKKDAQNLTPRNKRVFLYRR